MVVLVNHVQMGVVYIVVGNGGTYWRVRENVDLSLGCSGLGLDVSITVQLLLMISAEVAVHLIIGHLSVRGVVLWEDSVHENVSRVVTCWLGSWYNSGKTFGKERTFHILFLEPVVLRIENHMVMEMVHVVDVVMDNYTSLV